MAHLRPIDASNYLKLYQHISTPFRIKRWISINDRKFPTSSEKQEIEKEIRKKSLEAHINLTQLTQIQPEQNSGSNQDEQHNENKTSTAMLLQVFDENNADGDFVPGERVSGKEHQKNRIQILITIFLIRMIIKMKMKLRKSFGLLFRDLGKLLEKIVMMKFL